MNLNSKKLPEGLITLEGIFNFDDQVKITGSNLIDSKDDYTPITVADGKTLNLGKLCSETEQEFFINLCQEFNDVIAWIYKDLKDFDPILFQHTIYLNQDAKPVRQKQRPINPKIEPLIKKELSKLIQDNIIFPI